MDNSLESLLGECSAQFSSWCVFVCMAIIGEPPSVFREGYQSQEQVRGLGVHHGVLWQGQRGAGRVRQRLCCSLIRDGCHLLGFSLASSLSIGKLFVKTSQFMNLWRTHVLLATWLKRKGTCTCIYCTAFLRYCDYTKMVQRQRNCVWRQNWNSSIYGHNESKRWCIFYKCKQLGTCTLTVSKRH